MILFESRSRMRKMQSRTATNIYEYKLANSILNIVIRSIYITYDLSCVDGPHKQAQHNFVNSTLVKLQL